MSERLSSDWGRAVQIHTEIHPSPSQQQLDEERKTGLAVCLFLASKGSGYFIKFRSEAVGVEIHPA